MLTQNKRVIAGDLLGISHATYAGLEVNPARITAGQAQKLAELYKVSIGNLLSEATPIFTYNVVIKQQSGVLIFYL